VTLKIWSIPQDKVPISESNRKRSTTRGKNYCKKKKQNILSPEEEGRENSWGNQFDSKGHGGRRGSTIGSLTWFEWTVEGVGSVAVSGEGRTTTAPDQ